jgi:NTE family protein
MRDVVLTDLATLTSTAVRLMLDLTLGGLVGAGRVHAFLDASPLRRFLQEAIPIEGVRDAIARGHLYALAVAATSYHSGRSYIFIEGAPGHPLWAKSRRVALPVEMTIDHVCASAAIPLVFPPVCLRVAGRDLYFGDGGLRLVNPLSPAIRLGASRVLAIGVRSPGAAAALSRAEVLAGVAAEGAIECPPLAQICGVFMNAVFLDHLDADLDHLRRMNELVRAHGEDVAPAAEPMRTVEPLMIAPSHDLAIVAKAFSHRMPVVLRYVLDGLGTPDAQSADLMSYLLFDGAYTRALVDIGYQDADARLDEIETFLCREASSAEEAVAAAS